MFIHCSFVLITIISIKMMKPVSYMILHQCAVVQQGQFVLGPGLMYLRRDLHLPAWAVLVLMTSTVEICRPLPGGVAVQTTWLTCTTCTACLQIRLQTLAGGNEQEDINFISSDSPTGQQTIEIRR